MGAWTSAVEDPVLQVWTSFLKKRVTSYDKWALLAVITWCESHKLNVSEEATVDLKTWERAGQYILTAASSGNDSAINVIKPWRFVMDLLKQLKNERDARAAEEMQKAPYTEVRGENRVPGEVAGSADIALGKRGRRSGGADTVRRETTAWSREASLGVGDMPAEHSAAVQNCAATPQSGMIQQNITPLRGAVDIARTETACHRGVLPPSRAAGTPSAAVHCASCAKASCSSSVPCREPL